MLPAWAGAASTRAAARTARDFMDFMGAFWFRVFGLELGNQRKTEAGGMHAADPGED